MGRKTVEERIFEYCVGSRNFNIEELDQEAADVFTRWKYMDMLARKHRPFIRLAKIVEMCIERFDISERTALYDWANTDKLFGIIQRSSKMYEYIRLKEANMQLYSIAVAAGDFKAAAMCLKESARLVELMDALPDNEVKGSEVLMPVIFQLPDGTSMQKTLNARELNQLPTEIFAELLKQVTKPSVSPADMERMLDITNLQTEDEA